MPNLRRYLCRRVLTGMIKAPKFAKIVCVPPSANKVLAEITLRHKSGRKLGMIRSSLVKEDCYLQKKPHLLGFL